MILHLNNRHPNRRISRPYLGRKTRKALKALGRGKAELGLSLVTDREIAALNRRFLGRKGPTDVLSFPMDSGALLGDVVVSLDTAAIQARGEGRRLREQVMILVIHGVLHLLGHDHGTMREKARMRGEEGRLCRLLGIGGEGLL